MNISVSSVAFRNIHEIVVFLKGNPSVYLEFGVNLRSHDVDALVTPEVKSFSLHVPSPNLGYFPNFASFSSETIEKSYDILDCSLKTAVTIGAKIMVLHAGYTDEVLLPSLFEERGPYLERQVKSLQAYVLLKEGAISNKFYVNSPFYDRYLNNVIKALKDVNKYLEQRGIILAVENLNPRLLYLFQRPTDFIMLTREIPNIHICLDVGHLWISSQVNQFDFYEGLEKILATGQVVTCHLHNNYSDNKKRIFADEHNHLKKGYINMERVLDFIKRFDVLNLTVEVKEDPTDDVRWMQKYI